MKRRLFSVVFFLAVACLVGVACGQLLCASISFRSALGHLFGRGKLVALVHGSGIYESDIIPGIDKDGLVADAEISFQSRGEDISRSMINREYELIASQLPDKKNWSTALRANRLCSWSLRSRLARNLRCAQWIERRLRPQFSLTEDACRNYFETHAQEFVLPERFRAAHLFLAAPTDTPEETVDLKRRAIEGFLSRLDQGEKFLELVSAFSEDEATKTNQGDLGYFSDFRMPADFMMAIRQLRVGETSRVVQTALGFHVIQLTDAKPSRQMGFDEAEPEIRTRLENEQRATALRKLVADASRQGESYH